MKKIFYLISIFFVFSFYNIYAQTISGENQEKKVEIDIPNPVDLSSNWWDYFDVGEEEFIKRKEKFLSSIKIKNQNFSADQIEVIDSRLKNIHDNLNVLEDYKKKQVVVTAFTEDFKQSYTLEDMRRLGEEKNQLYRQLTTLKLQHNLEKKALSSKESKYHSLFKKYEDIEKMSYKKMIMGLDLIKLQLFLVIDEMQINKSNAYIEELKQKLSFLDDEVVFARHHLVYEKNQYESNLVYNKKLIEQLKVSKDKLEQLNNEIDFLDYQQNIDNLKYHEISQILLKESINEAQIKAKILINEIERYFLILGLKIEKIKTSVLYKKINKFSEEYSLIKNEKVLWKKQADQNFEKSLQYLTKTKSTNATQGEKLLGSEQMAKDIFLDLLLLEDSLFLSDFFIDQFTQEVQENYTSFKDIIYSLWTSVAIFFKTHVSWFNETLFKIGKKPITPLGLIKFIVILAVTYILSKLFKRYIIKIGLKQKRVSPYAIYTLSRLSFYIMMFLGIIVAFISLDIDFTAFAFIAGALGVGIGFGLQSIFNNFISGIILLLEKNVRVGDFIQLETGEYGAIKAINVRTTLMKTLDNQEILIPNADLALKKFTNWTLSEKIRRVRIPFAVAYGTDKELVKKVVVQAAKTVSITITDKPIDVWLVEFGENALNFELVVWVNEKVPTIPVIATKASYLWAIESALKENNIEIPFPQRDVHIIENEKRGKYS